MVTAESLAELRSATRAALLGEEVQRELAQVRDSPLREPDVRRLYRALGRAGLLAAGWPVEYGGGGVLPGAAAVVAEELVRAGLPDTLHVNSIQIVASFLLLAGDPTQRACYLPALGAGQRFASVLYTEPEAGSDLVSLRTLAVRDGDGYRLTGTKVFSVKSDITDWGLCAARTCDGPTPYEGISLFLVDLHAEGVRRETIASMADEQFHRVVLDGVRVPATARLGAEGDGWRLLGEALGIERTGLDYAIKARRLYGLVVAALPSFDAAAAPQIGRYGAGVAAAEELTARVVEQVAIGVVDPAAAAAAKYFSSELAAGLADWAVSALDFGFGVAEAAAIDSAVREAPGLTISAGTSEVMLEIVAAEHSAGDDFGRDGDLDADPTLRALRGTIRERLAGVGGPTVLDPIADGGTSSAAWAALMPLCASGLEVPIEAGGLELGLAPGVVLAEELGRAGLDSPYRSTMLAVDALEAGVAQGRPGNTAIPQLAAVGKWTAAVGGLRTGPAIADLRATAQDAGWIVDGSVVHTPSAGADALLVPIRLGHDEVLAMLAAEQPNRRDEPGPTPDLVTAHLDRVVLRPDDVMCVLARPHGDDPVGGKVMQRAKVRQAGFLLGLAAGALGHATHYVTGRRQFGKALADMQSVTFRIAKARIAIDAARVLVRRATRAAEDRSSPIGASADQALGYAARTAMDVTRLAVHLHGARGMTDEAAVHRHYRLATLETARFGPIDRIFARAARTFSEVAGSACGR